MRFIAIDFETANEKRSSPCSIGISVFERDRLIDEKYYLIKPKENRFEPMNIWIHGITQEDVEQEREFDEIWDEIKGYFHKSVVVAHNASFDMSVLRKTLELYNIEYPEFEYFCTLVMSKKYFKGLSNYKLNTVASALKYEFLHHQADEDARACGKVFASICKDLKVRRIEDIETKLGVKRGCVFQGGYKPCGNDKGAVSVIDKKEVIDNRFEKISEYGFRNKNVVFTGGLKGLTRGEAMKLIRKAGGNTLSSVSKKTDILIAAGKMAQSREGYYRSTKFARAEKLISQGFSIEIISEEEFLNRLSS